ncbi:lysozyme inhibitor LprI family protein [Nostoc sp. MG11]|uniref:lysozyme inhibitor LprI family protein n=1 Tax=Nostoc sp. MG11 TaxID=2721166 RepID=UPI001865CEA2
MRQLLLVFINILTFSSLDTSAVTITSTTPDITEILFAQNLNCNNAQTQAEINRCTQLFYQNTDKKLNQVYQQLLPKLERSRRQKLTTAQQAWIKFRDTSCEFEKSRYEGGSIIPTVYFTCLEKTTKQRTQQLQEYLKSDP